MVNDSANRNSVHRCFQCGSELIFVSQETVQLEGSRYLQVNSTYRCSNLVCQEKKDKEKADRLELRQKQAEVASKRVQKIQEKRKIKKKSKSKPY